MPLYSFHLSCGARTYPAPEVFEFPTRSAARAEALAVIRDLTHGQERTPRRWAGWFLSVSDAEGQFLSLPVGEPALAVISDQVQSETEPLVEARLAELVRLMLEHRQRTEHLLDENEQLRQELASQITLARRVTLRTRQILSNAQAVGWAGFVSTDVNLRTSRSRRSRPRLIVLPGGR